MMSFYLFLERIRLGETGSSSDGVVIEDCDVTSVESDSFDDTVRSEDSVGTFGLGVSEYVLESKTADNYGQGSGTSRVTLSYQFATGRTVKVLKK